jgi:hypothetical protein
MTTRFFEVRSNCHPTSSWLGAYVTDVPTWFPDVSTPDRGRLRCCLSALLPPPSHPHPPPPLSSAESKFSWRGCQTMMLNSSVRRVVRSSALSLSSVAPAVGVGASATGFLSTASRRAHPRRYSSSKPPVPPNDGSRPMDASSQTPAKGVNPAGQKREGKASKRKGKDNGRNGSAKLNQSSASLNLPSVPSTQHLQPQGESEVAVFEAGPLAN